MSRKSLIWIIGIIATGAILLKLEHCSYAQLGEKLTMEGITKTITSKFTEVKHITTGDLATELNQPDKKKSTLLIDSRTPGEFKISHLEGAQNLQTTNDVQTYLATLSAPPERIVVYCSVGYRSADLATKIQQAKITQTPIQNLLGSIFSWANEGRPLFTQNSKPPTQNSPAPRESPTTKVHPFDKKWGKLLNPEHRADNSNKD
ncbi:MAG: rhodanese-like domain-containing protein [Verrucomicrobia bacterium]|nr:rhodanese-like domain-containing protein [Verrucomicrobiota bacterium]